MYFQLARRLVAAELQQITYKEYLPLILGKAALLDLDSDETNYDPSVNPSILNEFATVAFRSQNFRSFTKILLLFFLGLATQPSLIFSNCMDIGIFR